MRMRLGSVIFQMLLGFLSNLIWFFSDRAKERSEIFCSLGETKQTKNQEEWKKIYVVVVHPFIATIVCPFKERLCKSSFFFTHKIMMGCHMLRILLHHDKETGSFKWKHLMIYQAFGSWSTPLWRDSNILALLRLFKECEMWIMALKLLKVNQKLRRWRPVGPPGGCPLLSLSRVRVQVKGEGSLSHRCTERRGHSPSWGWL